MKQGDRAKGRARGGEDPMTTPDFMPPASPGPSDPLLIEDDRLITSASSVSTSGRAGRFAVAGLVGVLGLGGAFAARSAFSGPAGPASPDEAVTEFFAALDAEDFVGLAAVVHPGERESIAEPLFAMLDHGKRLEIVSADIDPAAAGFLDITVDGLTYSVENTGPGLRYVTTTGGTISAPTSPEVPPGPLWDVFDLEPPAPDLTRIDTDLASEPMNMAVVEHDGSWYVSLWYSAAEQARREAGLAFPGLGTGPEPVGSESPDAVLEDLVRAAFDLEAEPMLTLLDPEEAAALYDYAPLYIEQIQEGLDDLDAYAELGDIEWTVDSVDFSANEVNGRQVISFASMEVSFAIAEGDLTDAPISGSVRFADGCLVTTVDGETDNSCDVDDSLETEVRRIGEEVISVLDLSATTVDAFERLAGVDTGLTVVERDGRWYLSLMPTVLETGNDLLAVLEAPDLVAFGTDIEELIERQDELAEELTGVLRNADWQALDQSGGASAMSELVNRAMAGGVGTATDPGSLSFDPVGPDENGGAGGFTDDIGPLEDVLAPSVADYFAVEADGTFLAWHGDLSAAPAFVAGAYAFDASWEGSVEVVLLDGPADPLAVLGDGWTFDIDGAITVATDEWGTTFAFVGEYVVWGDLGSDAGTALFEEQIAVLAAS